MSGTLSDLQIPPFGWFGKSGFVLGMANPDACLQNRESRLLQCSCMFVLLGSYLSEMLYDYKFPSMRAPFSFSCYIMPDVCFQYCMTLPTLSEFVFSDILVIHAPLFLRAAMIPEPHDLMINCGYLLHS
jgi:hypothetical protein